MLDAPFALARKLVEDRALDAQWGLDNLTALCAADEQCAEAYDVRPWWMPRWRSSTTARCPSPTPIPKTPR